MTGAGLLEGVPRAGGRAARRIRLAIMTSHPIQYQAPFFRALAEREDVDPMVFFGSRHGVDVAHDTGFGTAFRWDVPLVDGYAHEFLENAASSPDVSSFLGVRVRGLGSRIVPGRFDACLVMGWHTAAHVQAIAAALRNGVPLLLRGESTLQRVPGGAVGSRLRSRIWHPVRRRVYRAVFERTAAFITTGTRNADYYRHFGVPDERLYSAPYGVDNAHFDLAPATRLAARERIRRRIGAGDTTLVVASSAKLIPRKRPLDLVAAAASARALGADIHLVFIGDGELREVVRRAAEQAGLTSHVTITGFVNQREIPDWYAGADLLALPSDSLETWGLVVNEAMASGLPVLVSDAAGCAPDLVRPDVNGYTFPCGDVGALAALIERVAGMSPERRARMGEASRAIVDAFDVRRVADVCAQALRDTVPAGRLP